MLCELTLPYITLFLWPCVYFQALTKHHTDLRRQHQTGVHHEERFLEETAQREENYESSINELEAELKAVNSALERVIAENERLTANVSELSHQVCTVQYIYLGHG